MCCTICAGPFEVEVPVPNERGGGADKPASKDWAGFAQAVIAILTALAQILGPIIGPHGAEGAGGPQNQPAGAPGDKPGQRPQR
jgi:hypothetical protein